MGEREWKLHGEVGEGGRKAVWGRGERIVGGLVVVSSPVLGSREREGSRWEGGERREEGRRLLKCAVQKACVQNGTGRDGRGRDRHAHALPMPVISSVLFPASSTKQNK